MSVNYNAMVNITAQYKGEQDIKRASEDLSSLSGTVKGLSGGLKALAGLWLVKEGLQFTKSIIDMGDAMQELRQKTGIGVQALSDLKAAAEKGGTNFEGLEVSLKKFSVTLTRADAGSAQALAGFRALGISVKDSSGQFKSSDQVLLEISDRLANIPDSASKAAVMVALFGKTGADMIPVLNGGSKAIKGMGAQMSENFVAAADKFNDSLVTMKNNAISFGAAVLEKVLPYVNKAIDIFNRTKFTAFGPVLEPEKKEPFGPPAPQKGKIDTKFLGGDDQTKKIEHENEALAKLKETLQGTQQAYQLETQRLSLTTAQFEEQKIAIEEMTKAKREDSKFTADGKKKYEDLTREIIAQKIALIELQEEQKKSFGVGAQQALNSYAESIRDVAAQSKQLFTDAFKGIEDALVAFVETGKLSFESLAKSIETELIRIAVRQAIIAPLIGLVSSAFAPGSAAAAGGAGLFGHGALTPSAMGNVMTPNGPMALHKYARGGVATGPQMALFGEGSMNEAYVPLPDGRRIPVDMKGGSGTSVEVNVYMDSSGGSRESSNASSAQGKQLGALISAAVKQQIIQERRPGGVLG